MQRPELLLLCIHRGQNSVTLSTGRDKTLLNAGEAVVRIQHIIDPEWIEQFEEGKRYHLTLEELT
jgi:hypothetical protein